MTYCDESDVEAVLGISITSESLPTSTQISNFIERADSIINGYLHISTNITDSIGYLKTVAVNLVYKLVNNQYAMVDPKKFGPMPIALTDEEKTMIKFAYQKWTAHSFEVGIDD